jgi:hypothetical protein
MMAVRGDFLGVIFLEIFGETVAPGDLLHPQCAVGGRIIEYPARKSNRDWF